MEKALLLFLVLFPLLASAWVYPLRRRSREPELCPGSVVLGARRRSVLLGVPGVSLPPIRGF